MDLEFKRKLLRLKLDDQTYELKFPTVRQVDEFSNKAKGKEDDLSPTLSFLENLGLPEKVSLGMEPDMLKTVIETLSGQKKS